MDIADDDMSAQRVAVVHEWISARAGSEQTFEAIARLLPAAELFALSKEPDVRLETGGRSIATTWLDHVALRRHRSLTLPLMPLAWRSLGRDRYDFVISSHHAFAHMNQLTTHGVHLAYVYSPARYVWSPDLDERGAGRHLAVARAALKVLDRRASHRVASYAAISTAVAERVLSAWGRDAEVIHPPVQVDYFTPAQPSGTKRGEYVLGVGRWIPYKNLHLVVEAASLVGMPVKIAGRGPERARIEAAAKDARVPVEIIESPSNEELRDLYQEAAVLVFPTHEDFGIVPVEAQAAGTPVVAFGVGGARDTIIDGVSGILTASIRPADLASAITSARDLPGDGCVQSARRFTPEVFDAKIRDWVGKWGIST